MKQKLLACIVLVLLSVVVSRRPLYAANAVVGTGTPASCTEAAFNTALATVQASSGILSFNCGGNVIIEFTAGKIITSAPIIINGDNNVTLSGGDSVRLFWILNTGNLTLNNITLSNGYSNFFQGGGAILNNGVITLNNTTIRDSHTGSDYSGGGMQSQGPAIISNSLFENNSGGSAGGLFLVGNAAQTSIMDSTFQNNVTTNPDYGYGGAITVWFGADVTISNSLITNNQARYGGALYNEAEDALISLDQNTIVTENSATVSGGGIFNSHGTLTLTNIEINNNSAGENGGGLEVGFGGTANLINISLNGNTAVGNGGGIGNAGGTITLIHANFSNNNAGEAGGGFSNSSLGTANYTNSIFNANTANKGGGLSNSATLTLSQTTISNNSAVMSGRGIFTQGLTTISNSTLNGNTGSPGGAIATEGVLYLTNVTISGNDGNGQGGGLANYGEAYLTNVTFFGGRAGESMLYNFGSASYQTIALKNVVIDSGVSGIGCEIGGATPITSAGHNLSRDDSCSLNSTGDIQNIDPKLGLLTNNGGATLTHMILKDSPAIDAGTCVNGLEMDQRGVARPKGASCDIGAVERQPEDGVYTIYLPMVVR